MGIHGFLIGVLVSLSLASCANGMESNEELMPQELALLGDGQLMYSSDFPHGEGRDTAAGEIIARTDITEDQKRRILYDNAVDFYGAP